MQNVDVLHVNSFSSTNLSNNSQFVYDPVGRCVKIIETVSGSVTSTKQFVWSGSSRCEERDGSGTLSNGKQFLGAGQLNFASGTPASYFYTVDNLDSTRELTDLSGTVKTVYSYDPYGQVTETFISGSIPSDFQYAKYFLHTASGLNLMPYRAYSPNKGRWLSRDPLGELAGPNLYEYTSNNPMNTTDFLGLFAGKPVLGAPKCSKSKKQRVIRSPFLDCLGGESDPDCCRDNLVACFSLAQELRRKRVITYEQEHALQDCCRGVNQNCVDDFIKQDKDFMRKPWEDCFTKIIPNIIFVYPH
jgi:RHS repeat-associated protein